MFYIFFADGFEEVEAIATLDVIKRAGIEIESVGIGSKSVTGAHGINITCDKSESEIEINGKLNGIILPGGMPGTTNLLSSKTVNDSIDYCYDNHLFICAICAAPLILGRKGILKGRKAVCFPGFENELKEAFIPDDFVCRDDNIITAKGMGSAVNFGLEIVSAICGKNTADNLKSTLQCS